MSAHSAKMVSLCEVTRTFTHESTRFCTEFADWLLLEFVALFEFDVGPLEVEEEEEAEIQNVVDTQCENLRIFLQL